MLTTLTVFITYVTYFVKKNDEKRLPILWNKPINHNLEKNLDNRIHFACLITNAGPVSAPASGHAPNGILWTWNRWKGAFLDHKNNIFFAETFIMGPAPNTWITRVKIIPFFLIIFLSIDIMKNKEKGFIKISRQWKKDAKADWTTLWWKTIVGTYKEMV